MAILDGLIGYWSLDEASGSRADSVGGNTLTEQATVTSTTGLHGNAAQFDRAIFSGLVHADNATLSFGGTDFTFAAWIKIPAGAAGAWAGHIVSKGANNDGSACLWNNYGQLEMSVKGPSGADCSVATTATYNDGAWHFVVGEYRLSDQKTRLYIDTDPALVAGSALVGTLGDGTDGFAIGMDGALLGFGFTGPIDEVGVWKRTLTATERRWLYNGGSGRTFTEIQAGVPLSYGLKSFWELEEASGNRADSVGSTTLVPTAAHDPGNVAGKVGNAMGTLNGGYPDGVTASTGTPATIADTAWSLCGWWYPTFSGGTPRLAGKWGSTDHEWKLDMNGTSGKFQFVVRDAGDTTDYTVTSSVFLASNTWFFIHIWHDPDLDQIGIQINTETPVTAAFAGGTRTATTVFALGGTPDGLAGFYGNIDQVGLWDRVLTADEQAWLFNNGAGRSAVAVQAGIKIGDNLVAYWRGEEASGTRTDATGRGNDLTESASAVSGVAGLKGNAMAFEAANSEYLERTSNGSDDLCIGDYDWTFAFWVKLASITSYFNLIGKDIDTPANSRDYFFYFDYFTPGYVMVIGNTGLQAGITFTSSTGTWYFICGGHDAVNNQAWISVNAGTPAVYGTGGIVPNATAAPFRLGASAYSGFERYLDGQLDEVGFWKRRLAPSEIAWLYNGGAGRAYADLVPAAASIALTLPDGAIGEADVVAGGKRIVLTLTGDTWVP